MNKSRIVLIAGVLLLVAGIGFSWFYYDSTMGDSEQDNVLQEEASVIEQGWSNNPKPSPSPSSVDPKDFPKEPVSFTEGEPIGVLKIPAWGEDWATPIIEGTTADSLEEGVGHYSNSRTPGEIGNFAVAGHRSGDPQPFRNLLELKVGDEIIVETELATYTYSVTSPATETTVKAKDGGWVISEPDISDYQNKSVITLTTCTHLYQSPDRSVLFGELIKKELK